MLAVAEVERHRHSLMAGHLVAIRRTTVGLVTSTMIMMSVIIVVTATVVMGHI